MQNLGVNPSRHGLETHGMTNVNQVYWNLGTAALTEHALRRGEGLLANNGALVVRTGQYTGRSPNDKFIVREPSCGGRIWWGPINQPFDPGRFDALYGRLLAYLQRTDLYVQDCFAGADPRYGLPIRVVNQLAWHNLFARQLFVRADPNATADHHPRFTVIHLPEFHADPEIDGTRSEAFVIVHFARGLVIIGGTSYAGEMKKSIFSILNYLLPQQNVMPMHCSASVSARGDAALFFGLSGTGKTTLSADPTRRLVGDDEHGWTEEGIYNFEGGCYAKCIRLRKEHEPQIWNAIHYGAVLENVVIDPLTRRLDYDDASLTENTRAAYPATFIDDAMVPGVAGHPKDIVFLTCDAFGVLPPLARLTREQTMYHFLSGYTAKVAGTERGMGPEPQATFSTCFGAPFLPLHPTVYATMLGGKIVGHDVNCWLVNTGWSGGPYGAGQRIQLSYTRALVRAALDGRLADAPLRPDPIFRILVPTACPEIPPEILTPRSTWRDPAAYDSRAGELAALFAKNFAKFTDIPPAVIQAGPVVG